MNHPDLKSPLAEELDRAGVELHETTSRGKTPHRCPICEGHGNVPGGWYTTLPGVNCFSSTAVSEPCRSCNSTGILWS